MRECFYFHNVFLGNLLTPFPLKSKSAAHQNNDSKQGVKLREEVETNGLKEKINKHNKW